MVSVISFYNYLEENLVCSKLIGSPDYLTFVPFLNSLVPNYQSGMLAKTTEALLSYCSTFQCFEVKNDVELYFIDKLLFQWVFGHYVDMHRYIYLKMKARLSSF